MRAPVFAGVAVGVGTTTLATALHGIDAGCYTGRPVDVLVSRTDTLAGAAVVPGAPVLALRIDGPLTPAARAWLDRLRPRFGVIVLLPEVAHWGALDEPPAAEAARLLAVPAERRPRALRSYADALLQITAGLVHDGALTGARSRPAPSRSAPSRSAPSRSAPSRSAPSRSAPPRPTPPPPAAVPPAPHRPPGAPGLPQGRGVPAPPRRSAQRPLWRGLAPVEQPAPTRSNRPPATDSDLDDDAIESREPAWSR